MPTESTDAEAAKGPKEHLEGFADLSYYVGSDETLSIYRRFGSLGARNILYLQGELQFLEAQLNKLDDNNSKLIRELPASDEKTQVDNAARAWEAFSFYAEGDERQARKMRLVLKICEVMKLYEEAVLRRSQILGLDAPKNNTLSAFGNWFRTRKPFCGICWHLLDDEEDLMALKKEPDSDRFTVFIEHYFGYYLKVPRKNMPASWKGMYYFPARRVAWMVAILILALYFVPSRKMGKRLIVVGVFTTTFAGSIGLLTNAKRVEIFAASAAYTAVLVVFLTAPTT